MSGKGEMVNLMAGLFLVVWASGLAYQDWRWRRLPNVWLLAGVLAGGLHCLVFGVTPFGASVGDGLIAATLALLLLLPLYAAGWMGAGDVKLLAVVGWLGGAQIGFSVFILASVLGGLMALLLLLPQLRPLLSGATLPPRLQGRIPFGAGVAAVVVAVIFGWLDGTVLPFQLTDLAHA